MRRTWNKFWGLPFGDKILLLTAFVLLPVIRVGMRMVGFGRLCRILASMRPFPERASSCTQPTEVNLVRARSTAALVRIAANRGLYRANCLDQSVTLWWLLRLQGIETEIRIGVRKNPRLEAHAWVELDSVVVNDRDDISEAFAPFSGYLFKDAPIG